MTVATIPPKPATAKAADANAGTGQSVKLTFEGGDTTIEKPLTFEVEMASYAALREVAQIIRTRLRPHVEAAAVPINHLFFVDNALRAALDLPASVRLQLSNLLEAFRSATATARGGLGAAGGSLSSEITAALADNKMELKTFTQLAGPAAIGEAAMALIGALRTDTRYFGQPVVIPEQALVLALAHAWERTTVQFHYPTLFMPPSDVTEAVTAEFVHDLDLAMQERNRATQAISRLVSHVGQLKPTDPGYVEAKSALESARDQFHAAEIVLTDVSATLTKPDESTGLTQLQLLARAAVVTKRAKDTPRGTFYLFAQVLSAGGALRVSKNFFRSLLGRDGLKHSGGATLVFAVFNSDGLLLASDIVGMRSAYQNSRPGLRLA